MSKIIYELIIRFTAPNGASSPPIKEAVCAWLVRKGRSDFVEGIVDGVVDALSENEHRSAAVEDQRLATAPIALYDRERAILEGMLRTLEKKFDVALSCEIHDLPDSAWNDCWRPEFEPWHTQFFLVVPKNFGPTTFDHLSLQNIVIDAREGAFGTGQHSTTRCLMMMLEQHWQLWQPRRVLDVGAGTGILSIASAKLGAVVVHGTEIDQALVGLARENFLQNRVASSICEASDPWDGASSYDLVIANILVPVLHDLMPSLRQCTSIGGRLLLSGFIAKEAGPLLARAKQHGFVEEFTIDEMGWLGLSLIRRV